MSDFPGSPYQHYRIRERARKRAQRALSMLEFWHGVRHAVGRWQFWAGMTLGFPLEHWLWEHVWPFTLITRWLNL